MSDIEKTIERAKKTISDGESFKLRDVEAIIAELSTANKRIAELKEVCPHPTDKYIPLKGDEFGGQFECGLCGCLLEKTF